MELVLISSCLRSLHLALSNAQLYYALLPEVRANTITNVVASASKWDLRTDAGCGAVGCDPRLTRVTDERSMVDYGLFLAGVSFTSFPALITEQNAVRDRTGRAAPSYSVKLWDIGSGPAPFRTILKRGCRSDLVLLSSTSDSFRPV